MLTPPALPPPPPQYTVNFLNLLIDQSRIEALEPICESFEKSYCALTDTQVATLRSAVKLEQEQQFLIAKKLQELTGSKNIKLKPVVDADLVAGFVVEYGSTQIDLSGAQRDGARPRCTPLRSGWCPGSELGAAAPAAAAAHPEACCHPTPTARPPAPRRAAVKGQLEKITGELVAAAQKM